MAKKLTDKERKQVIAYYTECQNYCETGRKFNISEAAVRKIVKKDDGSAKMFEQKSIENTNSVIQEMESRRNDKIELLDDILKAMKKKAKNPDVFTNIKDLATAYGIILDKEIKIKELDSKNENNNQEIEDLTPLAEMLKITSKEKIENQEAIE